VLHSHSSPHLDELIQSGFDEMDRVLASRRSTHPSATTSSPDGIPLRRSGVSVLMHNLEHGGGRRPDSSSPSVAHSDASASLGSTRRGSIKRTGSHLNVDAPCFVPRFATAFQAGSGAMGAGRVAPGSSERLPQASEAAVSLSRGEASFGSDQSMHGSDSSMHCEAHRNEMAPTEEEQEWLDRQVRFRSRSTAPCPSFSATTKRASLPFSAAAVGPSFRTVFTRPDRPKYKAPPRSLRPRSLHR
jgi:hypothetical protein